MALIECRGGSDVYPDRVTGREVFVGRTTVHVPRSSTPKPERLGVSGAPDLVERIAQACRQLADDDEKPFQLAADPQSPALLYHFTSIEGLSGIVKSNRLWANLTSTQNDASEVTHGVQQAKAVALRALEGGSGTALSQNFYSRVLSFLEDPAQRPSGAPRFDLVTFVLSLCGPGALDESGPWLNYGRSGAGVAIGFEPRVWIDSVPPLRVDYTVENQQKRMQRLLEATCTLLDPSPEGKADPIHAAEVAAHLVSIWVPVLASSMKHPSFSKEVEWRLLRSVLYANGEAREDSSAVPLPTFPAAEVNGLRVPRIEFMFQDASLREVVLGHSCDLAEDQLRLNLWRLGYKQAEVRRSTVPVRGAKNWKA